MTQTRERLIELGNRVKMIRKELHISQKDFAKKINVSGSFLSEVEAGKSKPGYDFFYNIAATCNVGIRYVLFGEGPMFEEHDHGPKVKVKEPQNRGIRGIDELLWYIERSPLLEHSVIAFSAKFLYDNETALDKEIDIYNKRNTTDGGNP